MKATAIATTIALLVLAGGAAAETVDDLEVAGKGYLPCPYSVCGGGIADFEGSEFLPEDEAPELPVPQTPDAPFEFEDDNDTAGRKVIIGSPWPGNSVAGGKGWHPCRFGPGCGYTADSNGRHDLEDEQTPGIPAPQQPNDVSESSDNLVAGTKVIPYRCRIVSCVSIAGLKRPQTPPTPPGVPIPYPNVESTDIAVAGWKVIPFRCALWGCSQALG